MGVSAVPVEGLGTRRLRATDRSREQTRARLISSGKQLFAKRGLHGVTTHDIARRAGVAAGTFYLHFKDKTELFREIAIETMAELRRVMESVSRPEVGLRDGVGARVAALVGFAEANRDVMLIIFGNDADAAEIESELLDRLAADIARGRSLKVESGEMPAEIDPAVMSQALVGMLARVVRWWLEDPTRATKATLIETLTRIQLSGTHPKPEDGNT
jgi:TetR/AcrR family acrAB operon transcriptional repressor